MVTRRAIRYPDPCPMPAHVTAVDEISTSHARLGVDGLTASSTTPRACRRWRTRRATRSAPTGGQVTISSNPSAAAATRSAHTVEPPSTSTSTTRARGTPSSLAASSPIAGVPTNAAHDPVPIAREITPSASDHAAVPLHPTTRPRCRPASGRSGANTSSTGRQRSRAGTSKGTVVTRRVGLPPPQTTEHVFGAPDGASWHRARAEFVAARGAWLREACLAPLSRASWRRWSRGTLGSQAPVQLCVAFQRANAALLRSSRWAGIFWAAAESWRTAAVATVTARRGCRCGARLLGRLLLEGRRLDARLPVPVHLTHDVGQARRVVALGDVDGHDVAVDVHRIDLAGGEQLPGERRRRRCCRWRRPRMRTARDPSPTATG